ncbi:MAG: TetR/AcrR family transcriptional regulator [Nevskiales bacterium]|nr:TetR/AcrR family transcriptional regulator [Nevskiales bacterium]
MSLSKRERNKIANRSAILDAARRCFLDQGYEAVTIRDVIRHSGLAAGTFYNYFPDKESLFRALAETQLTTLQDEIHAAREHAADFDSFFYESFLATFRQVRANPDFFQLMFQNERAVRSFYSDNLLSLLMQSLRADMQNAIVRGLLPELDVDMMTAITFGAAYEMARLIASQPRRSPEDCAAFVTRVFIRGFAPEQEVETRLIRAGSRLLQGAAR